MPGGNGRLRATATGTALTRRCSKKCRHGLFDAEPDFRRRAFLDHNGASHSGADQHARWHLRQVNADRNTLCQSDPGECGIDGREEVWTILVILIRDAPCYAKDGSLQRRGSVHEVNLDAGGRSDMREPGFLETRLRPI